MKVDLRTAVRKELEKKGYFVARQARSAFPDLIAVKDGRVVFVECKVNREDFSQKERAELFLLATKYNARALLAYRKGGKIRFEEVRREGCREMKELVERGFVRPSRRLNQYIRKHPELRQAVSVFKGGSVGRGRTKYSGYDLLGREQLTLYYLKGREEELSKYLEELFYKKNPEPNEGLRKAFTRLLHDHGLHWSGCCGARE